MKTRLFSILLAVILLTAALTAAPTFAQSGPTYTGTAMRWSPIIVDGQTAGWIRPGQRVGVSQLTPQWAYLYPTGHMTPRANIRIDGVDSISVRVTEMVHFLNCANFPHTLHATVMFAEEAGYTNAWLDYSDSEVRSGNVAQMKTVQPGRFVRAIVHLGFIDPRDNNIYIFDFDDKTVWVDSGGADVDIDLYVNCRQ